MLKETKNSPSHHSIFTAILAVSADLSDWSPAVAWLLAYPIFPGLFDTLPDSFVTGGLDFFSSRFQHKSSWLILISFLILVEMLFKSCLLIFALCHGFVYGISDYASNTVFLPFPSSFPPLFYGVSYTKGGKIR